MCFLKKQNNPYSSPLAIVSQLAWKQPVLSSRMANATKTSKSDNAQSQASALEVMAVKKTLVLILRLDLND